VRRMGVAINRDIPWEVPWAVSFIQKETVVYCESVAAAAFFRCLLNPSPSSFVPAKAQKKSVRFCVPASCS
jgi:hypothetical protein